MHSGDTIFLSGAGYDPEGPQAFVDRFHLADGSSTRIFRSALAPYVTPFGFQNEHRSYWHATDLYTKISPLAFADMIAAPLLMIHGMADDDTGTFTIQSERTSAAIEGNGGDARLVLLPDEAHGYFGQETNATVLAEMVDWLDRWVKNAPAR